MVLILAAVFPHSLHRPRKLFRLFMYEVVLEQDNFTPAKVTGFMLWECKYYFPLGKVRERHL